MQQLLDLNRIEDYRLFIKAKGIPRFRCHGRMIEVPDEYAHLLGEAKLGPRGGRPYKPIDGLFDYEADIARLAILKKKFSIFADCGLGKTIMLLEYAKHVAKTLPRDKRLLIVSPLMVVKQTQREAMKWYGKAFPLARIHANELAGWLQGETTHRIGITNYDALTDELSQGRLGGLILDESSSLKSAYGAWARVVLKLGDGLEYKLCCTGTPAPNDRIEFANHAVFMDAFQTVNAFLAKYFVNRGQTGERWELKPHALEPFYRDLSHWCIFLTNPATYGWKDNCENIPPIVVHIHDIDMTTEQREAVMVLTGKLFMDEPGGITKRAKLAQIGKGNLNGTKIDTLKPAYIRALVDSWPDESTIIWCEFNNEQEGMQRTFPEAGSISGDTPIEEREKLIDDFKERRTRILISKPSILGFGLNLQVATRQVFSGLRDSYEKFYQAVKRSNRYGSTLPLNVHLPVTEIERPMIDTVLRKASRIQRDTEEQEAIFKRWRVQA